MRIRGVVDLSMILFGIVVFVSGIALFIAPHGPHTYAYLWSFLGLSKETWRKIHVVSGFILTGICLIHIWLNRKALKAMI